MSLEGIDWVLCHGGADIWHAMPDRDSGRMAWETDEQWERHIDWRCAHATGFASHNTESGAWNRDGSAMKA